MLAFLSAAAPAVAVRPRPSLVESSFSIHALAVQASPEPSPTPSPLPAANTDATGMCGLELVYTPVGLSGAIEAFAFRADGKIVHSHARSASAAVWTPFRPVGDEDGAETRKFASGPTVVRAADGRLEVVARVGGWLVEDDVARATDPVAVEEVGAARVKEEARAPVAVEEARAGPRHLGRAGVLGDGDAPHLGTGG